MTKNTGSRTSLSTPPALAVRLLDIRMALRDEFVADLAWVKEENADIMKVACMSNLESSVSLDCDIDFDNMDEDDNRGASPRRSTSRAVRTATTDRLGVTSPCADGRFRARASTWTEGLATGSRGLSSLTQQYL